jgi:DNA-binding NtrC family response regulator
MGNKTGPGAIDPLSLLRTESFDAILSDRNRPGLPGMKLLDEICWHYFNMVFIIATGIDDARLGIQAMRRGADDYLIKPLVFDEVILSFDHAFHKNI